MSNLKLKPITNQDIWNIAKVIANMQKVASKYDTSNVDWEMLEEEWFDYLEECLTIQE